MACCGTSPLALARTAGGWVQRASFTHPDLHDELVEDLVPLASPLSVAGGGSGTVTFTFLLLGDQNAGKSTFLHAFTHAGDASWLRLSSFLPILSASFVNAQLRPQPSRKAPPSIDAPPFLDTDVGRARFLLTLEDFAFFVDEFALPISQDELTALSAAGARHAVRRSHPNLRSIHVAVGHIPAAPPAGGRADRARRRPPRPHDGRRRVANCRRRRGVG